MATLAIIYSEPARAASIQSVIAGEDDLTKPARITTTAFIPTFELVEDLTKPKRSTTTTVTTAAPAGPGNPPPPPGLRK